MNLKRIIPLIIVFLPAIISSCVKSTTQVASDVAAVDTTIFPVKTILLAKQQVSRNIEYTANLIPYEEINYAPASPGRIEEIKVDIGSHVRKGDVIARMEKTQLLQVSEQFENARSNYERMDTLRKLNSISEQQYEAAKTQYEVVRSNLDFLTRNTTLISPIDGIVTGKYFESGELYSGAPNTPSGKAAIVTLMQIDPMKAKINVAESYFPLLAKGMKVTVTVDIYPGQEFPGEVFRTYPTISSDTRTFPVEIVIGNSKELLRPGMFARVSLYMGEMTSLFVPATAVVKQEGTNDRYLFLVENDTIARKVLISLGERYDDNLEVISESVKEGQQLIISGQDKLLDKSKIKVVK
jgi:membrane fusion protein, multidrug efflux system